MSESRTKRVAIVGGGFMGTVHTRAARAAGAEVVGIVGSSEASATRAADRLGIPAASGSIETILDLQPDAIHICSPNAFHLDQTLECLSRGVPVICEKPIATSAEHALAMTQAAAEAGLRTAVPFVYRFHPMAREARERRGTRLLTILGTYLQDWLLNEQDENWRTTSEQGGPSRAFADIGSHLVDLVEFIAKERIVRLCAITRQAHLSRNGHPVGNEDAATVLIETKSGAIGTLLVSQVAAGRKNSLTVEMHFDGGSLRFDQEHPEDLWLGRRGSSLLLQRDPNAASSGTSQLRQMPPGHPMGYFEAFSAFVSDAYESFGGREMDGLPTFLDGLRAARVTEAVIASHASGSWTEVEMDEL